MFFKKENNREKMRVQETFNLSNESMIKICKHLNLLVKWQKAVNLVGNSTLDNLWNRHVLDSAQVIRFLPKVNKNKIILDIGSGAGFPGLVLTAMGREDVFLCESNHKKNSFLKEAMRVMNTKEKIYLSRIEDLNLNNVSVLVSRAFSSILNTFKFSFHLIKEETFLVLLKGKFLQKEIDEAKKEFNFSYEKFPSITSNDGQVVVIKKIRKINLND